MQLFSQTSSGTLCDINSIVNEFTEILSASCSKVLKMKGRRKDNKKNIPKQRQKWFNQNCHTLKKNLRNLGKLITKYPNNTFKTYIFLKKERIYKCLLRKLKGQFHNSMLEKIEAFADNNPNEYWKLVNSIKTSQKSKDHNEISSSEWFEYFKNLDKNEHLCSDESSTEAKIVKDYNKWAAQKIDVLDRPISTEELYKISKKLKNKKACANDPLSNEIIKLSVEILPSYFVNLFNPFSGRISFSLV